MSDIKLLNSQTASNVPSSLIEGQVAINEADGILYYRDAATGNPVALIWSGGSFTGAVQIDTGSGTAPNITAGLAFENDPDTGLAQLGGANSFSIVTNGTERVRVDSSGRVGIGNSSMASFNANWDDLVVGAGAAQHGMTVFSTTQGTLAFADTATTGVDGYRGYLSYLHASDAMILGTGAAERIRIDSLGRVGIGRTPVVSGTSLECANDIYVAPNKSALFYQTNGSAGLGTPSGVGLQVWAASNITDSIRFQGRDASGTFTATDILRIWTGGTSASRIGINRNTAPTVDLEIGDNTSTVRALSVRHSSAPAYLSNSYDGSAAAATLSVNAYETSANSQSWSALSNANFAAAAVRVCTQSFASGSHVSFWTAASNTGTLTERMRIASSGNVGIGTGTTTPTSRLDVNGVITVAAGTAAAPAIVGTGDADTGVCWPAANNFAASTAGVERLRIDSNGMIGINATPNSRKLTVRGSSTGDGALLLQSSSTGTATTNGFIIQCFGANSDAYVWNFENAPIIFGANNAERMRLYADGKLDVTNSVWAVNGSAGSPGFTFRNDTDTGIFQASGSADTLSISTAGHERVRVRSDGNVGIGSAGGSNAALWIQPTLSSASDRYGIYGRITGTTDSTSPIYTCSTFADLHSSASTSLAVNYQAIRPQLAAGASVTTAVGLLVQSSFTVATNNYGVQLSIGSGSGRWNIYADGTAANYFAGNVGIGSGRTAPASALDVNGVITVAATSGSAGSYLPSVTFSGDPDSGLGQASGANTCGIFAGGYETVTVDVSGVKVANYLSTTSTSLSGAGLSRPTVTALQRSANGYRTYFHGYTSGQNSGVFLSGENSQVASVSVGCTWQGSGQFIATQTSGTALSFDNGDIVFRGGSGWTVGNAVTLTERMRIDSSGRVGVNTASANAALHIKAPAAQSRGIIVERDSADAAGIDYNTTGGFVGGVYGINGGGVRLFTANGAGGTVSEAMRITPLSRVGIATTQPESLLHVSGVITVAATSGSAGSYAPSLTFSGDSNTGFGQVSGQSDSASIFTAGHERIRFDSGGKILVGATTSRTAGPAVHPVFQFEGTNAGSVSYQCIAGSGQAAVAPQIVLAKHRGGIGDSALVQDGDTLGIIRFNGGDGTDCVSNGALIECRVSGTPGVNDMPGVLIFGTTPDNGAVAQERMRIMPNGRVGIGTNNPSTTLHVVGSVEFDGPITEGYVDNGNSGTTKTIALTNGTVQNYTLTGTCTFTMPTAVAGQSFTVLIRTGAGGYNANFTGVKWPASGTPATTQAANKMDIFSFVSDGTNWYGTVQQGYTP